jgi:hypothetical protein
MSANSCLLLSGDHFDLSSDALFVFPLELQLLTLDLFVFSSGVLCEEFSFCRFFRRRH